MIEKRFEPGVTNTGAGVSPRKHKLNRNNIEQEVNEEMTEKRLAGIKEQFPMHVHKAGGLNKTVNNQDELDAALAKGWLDDIRKVVEDEPTEVPTDIRHMSLAQAQAHIAEHAHDAGKLAEIEAAETAQGGGRAPVLKLIDDAKDNYVPARTAKKGK